MECRLFLPAANLGEIIATSALKSSDGFTQPVPSLVVVVGYGLAFYFLSLALRAIPVAIAHAVWAGLGIALVAAIAWLFHGQKLDLWALLIHRSTRRFNVTEVGTMSVMPVRLAALGLALCAAAPVVAEPLAYRIDPDHTDVFAQWNHFGYSHPSIHFGGVSGTIVHDAQAPENSRVEATLPMAALSSRVAALDDHLHSRELFDVARHPFARFQSTQVTVRADGSLDITGQLNLKGVSRQVVLTATLNRAGGHPATGQPTIGFNARADLKRSDFGLDLYAPGISDEVTVHITTEASVPLPEQEAEPPEG